MADNNVSVREYKSIEIKGMNLWASEERAKLS